MLRILTLTVENNPGVLARISGMFSGKGYNLESLTVGPTIDRSISRITLACDTNDEEFEQIKKQLNRLIDVIKVMELTKRPAVSKELVLLKVLTKVYSINDIDHITRIFDCRIIDRSDREVILQICDTSTNIEKIFNIIPCHAISEVARSGLVGMLEC